jgi:ATP-dependent helicase/nuclease subunit A
VSAPIESSDRDSAARAAADPRASVFLTANAGSGKTAALIDRVARLLLSHAPPRTILCVTYTKAAAAEMQRRLFDRLGGWAVMEDAELREKLRDIAAPDDDLPAARRLFARALETPGGLQIQTIHAFCEKLLRRFPLEAGVSPGFQVLEDQAAAEVSDLARETVDRVALARPGSPLAAAHAHLSVELDIASWERMFADFAARRAAIAAYAAPLSDAGLEAEVWRRCGFPAPRDPADIRARAMARAARASWRGEAGRLRATGMKAHDALADALLAASLGGDFDQLAAVFLTGKNEPRQLLRSPRFAPASQAWLDQETARVREVCEALRACVVARDTLAALTLARAYGETYEGAKTARGALDFADLIDRTLALLTTRADAAWVLYKLDGGIDHILLDEAQDTAPAQWDILRALAAEFFTGLGARTLGAGPPRTVFAVADVKQSIFSFQGAAPERFGTEQRAFAAMIEGSGQRFRGALMLRASRRSRPEILEVVDAVFADAETRAGLAPAGAAPLDVGHLAVRERGGCVDLWPLEIGDAPPQPDPWRPVDEGPSESAGRKLARRIALAVRAMVEGRQAVGDRETGQPRRCRYGDVLILVRRRNALFHEIIRALKRAGVPVGGADRLQLAEHGLFRDLIALARFARFPADELSLAGVLRGPFCDLSEDDLFDLAHARQGALITVLTRRAAERPCWASAAALLAWVESEAARRSPFDFFNRLLSRVDAAGRSMRQRLFTRLGVEARDALDAFLAQAAAAEARGILDLETFVARLGGADLEVKREQDEGRAGAAGEVRVMTVHGAKGLEAPIVILPDTSTRATAQGGPLLDTGDGAFLWAPRKTDDCAASAAARDLRDTATDHESLRLLYVALTRARDRLILCGVAVQDRFYERSWRDYLDRAFARLPARPISLPGGGLALRYGADPTAPPELTRRPDPPAPLPQWALSPAPAEPALAPWRSPSTLVEAAGPPAPSPLAAVGGLGRYRRGDIIHRLLQLLPDFPLARRAAAAAALLDKERDLGAAQKAEMAAAALAVLADTRFAEVFGPHSRAEVALAGGAARLPPGLSVSGRLDRLVVTPAKVLVVDFKTNRPAPRRLADCDPAYITQMAVYVAVLAEIFPGRIIEAALIWTDGPKLMPVPAGALRRALEALGRQR